MMIMYLLHVAGCESVLPARKKKRSRGKVGVRFNVIEEPTTCAHTMTTRTLDPMCESMRVGKYNSENALKTSIYYMHIYINRIKVIRADALWPIRTCSRYT